MKPESREEEEKGKNRKCEDMEEKIISEAFKKFFKNGRCVKGKEQWGRDLASTFVLMRHLTNIGEIITVILKIFLHLCIVFWNFQHHYCVFPIWEDHKPLQFVIKS